MRMMSSVATSGVLAVVFGVATIVSGGLALFGGDWAKSLARAFHVSLET
jgi:hypothetical protein